MVITLAVYKIES